MPVCSLNYNLSLTGDCSNTNSGSFKINIIGDVPQYTISVIYPYSLTTVLPYGTTAYTLNNLSAGTYSLIISDSCSPQSQVVVNANISSGTCVSLIGHSNTICNLNNGAITAQTQSDFGTPTFYLYENTNGYISSGTSYSDSFIFNSLSAGTYYVVANDGGGCTGRSETCIIKSSTTLDYGFYVVNDAGCSVSSGRIYVTGVTGSSPYTYLWYDNSTLSYITGLTSGSYSVTVTDSTGCANSKTAFVQTVPPIGLGSITSESPSCFSSDGEVTITVTGGTAPFYFLGSNGDTNISFSSSYTFTGLSSGLFEISVTDAGLCKLNTSTTVLTPGGFSIVTIGTIDSNCNNSDGQINPILLLGGSPPYNYTLTNPEGDSTTVSTSSPSYNFSNLSGGTYTLTISDNGPCTYTNTYTINNTNKFTVSTIITDTVCGLGNGSVYVSLSTGGTQPYRYEITGLPSVISSQTAYTFNNLFSGNYVLTVTDSNLCTQTSNINVGLSNGVDFTLVGTDSTNGSNGQINAFITDGEPPFTLSWTANVNGQTGLTVTGLSAGDYTLIVTDSNGCIQNRTITLNGYNLLSSYQTYTYCSNDFVSNGFTVVKRPQQMLVEGYYDLTSGEENCILNQTIFTAEVVVNSVTASTQYYTGTTLGDYPSDDEWFNAIETLLTSFPEIGTVEYDSLGNLVIISTSCTSQALSNATIEINFKISYDISCVCPIPPPTPGPDLETCDMIYIQPGSEIYGYNFTTNISSGLIVDGYTFNSPSVAHSSDRLYLYEVIGLQTLVYEWIITLAPFTAILNRTITVPTTLGNSIGFVGTNLLISTDTSVNPNNLVLINITNISASVSTLLSLPTNRISVGTIQISNGQYYILNQDTSTSNYHLTIYATNLTQTYDLVLSPTLVNQPSGLFINSGVMYVNDLFGNIFSIDSIPPYNINSYGAISGAWVIPSISQISNTCFNTNWVIPFIGCAEIVNMFGSLSPFDGIYETTVELSNGTGDVELTYNGPGGISRVQVYWNNSLVADSLFLGIALANPISYNEKLLFINSISLLNDYIYTDGFGNSVTSFPNDDWTTNGSVNVSYTNSDVPPWGALRLFGNAGGQIGVVANYPTPAARATDNDIKLSFNKTTQTPTTCKVVVTNLEQGSFNWSITQCPS
jgi:hypothetical protein